MSELTEGQDRIRTLLVRARSYVVAVDAQISKAVAEDSHTALYLEAAFSQLTDAISHFDADAKAYEQVIVKRLKELAAENEDPAAEDHPELIDAGRTSLSDFGEGSDQ